jgi:antitoxin StbD
LVANAEDSLVVILNNASPVAYLLSVEAYEGLMDALDDFELAKIVGERRGGKATAINIRLDEL